MESFIVAKVITYIKTEGPEILQRLILGVIVFTIVYFFIQFIIRRIRRNIEGNDLTSDIYAKKNSKLVGSILFITLMIFNVLAVFQIIGFDSAIIMGGISLSIGFAMETTIGNLISGIFILTNKKIKLDDYIELLGSLKIRGTVEEINVRYTVIRGFDKRRTVIPNSIIAKTPLKTLKSEPILKGSIEFTVPRHTPFNLIQNIYKKIITNNSKIIYPEEATIIIKNFNTAGITIEGFFFTNPAKKMPVLIGRDIKKSLFEELLKYGIEVPYNHKTILLEN